MKTILCKSCLLPATKIFKTKSKRVGIPFCDFHFKRKLRMEILKKEREIEDKKEREKMAVEN